MLFIVFLSICYLCAKSHLNNMNPAEPPMLWMFQTMKHWKYTVTSVLFDEKHVRTHASKDAFWNIYQHLAGENLIQQTSL